MNNNRILDKFNIKKSTVVVFSEFSIESPHKKTKSKKIRDPINILPKLPNKSQLIKSMMDKWFMENVDDVNFVFNRIVNIYKKNKIVFDKDDDYIYDKFVEFLYYKNRVKDKAYKDF